VESGEITVSPALFWIFAVIMLGFGCGVVLNRNPVACALSLVVSFLALAALFVSLDAYFIGVIQVLVYAGAVMVLFLFIIMLLDLRAEQRRRMNVVAVAGGLLVTGGFIYQLFAVLRKFPAGLREFPPIASELDDVRNVGFTLFSSFNMPFQVIGVLALVATVGVVLLSKRELK
jgi:NADH-quinone oxidoreductase subunit J